MDAFLVEQQIVVNNEKRQTFEHLNFSTCQHCPCGAPCFCKLADLAPEELRVTNQTNHCFTIYTPLEPHYHSLLNNPIEISCGETLTYEFANWTLPFSLRW